MVQITADLVDALALAIDSLYHHAKDLHIAIHRGTKKQTEFSQVIHYLDQAHRYAKDVGEDLRKEE